MTWTHSIISAEDYKSPWAAVWNATTLSASLGTLKPKTPVALSPSPIRSKSLLPVSFAENVEICVYSDHGSCRPICMPHEGLVTWDAKPWSLDDSTKSTTEYFLPNNQEAHVDPLSDPLAVLIHADLPWPARERQYEIDIPGLPLAGRPLLANMEGWIQQLWQGVFAHQADVEYVDEGPVLYMLTWYLRPVSRPSCDRPRVAKLDLYYEDWEMELRRLWRDVMHPDEDCAFHLVYPEPPRSTGAMHSGHLIITQEIQAPSRAALISTFIRSIHDNQLNQIATITPTFVNRLLIRQLSQVAPHLLAPDTECWFDEEWIGDDWLPIPDGSNILQYVEYVGVGPRHTWHPHFFGNDDDSDAASFMARPPGAPPQPAVALDSLLLTPSGSSGAAEEEEDSWYTVVVYSLAHPPASGRVDWSSYDRLHRSIARLLEVHRDDLQAFYVVRTNPVELEYPNTHILLAHLHWDVLPGQSYKFTLLDVEFHSHQVLQQPETVREARLLPQRLTRAQLLHLLGVAPYCDALTDSRCLVWLNRELWWEQSLGHKVLEHGDYLRVALPPADGLNPEILTRQAAGHCFRGMDPIQINQWHTDHGFDPETSEQLPLLHEDSPGLMLMQRAATLLNPQAWSYDPLQPWIHQLGVRCAAHDFAKPIATWYLDHQRVRTMEHLRPLRLPDDPSTWFRALVQLWRDVLDHTTSVKVMVIDRSPGALDLDYCAAVLLRQNPDPPDAAAIISVHDDNAVGGAWTSYNFAAVVSGITFTSKFLSDIQYNHRCPPRDEEAECSIEVNGRDKTFSPSFSIDDGDCVTLHIVFPERRANQHFCSATPSWSSSSSSSTSPAPRLDIDRLQTIWNSAAFAWEHEEPVVGFITWYVDPHFQRQCIHRRVVFLGEDSGRWATTLARAWDDLHDMGFALYFHLVNPTPWDLEDHVAGHIILQERVVPDHVAVLMTHYDSLLGDAPAHRWATIIPALITAQSIAQEAGYPELATADYTCDVWHGSMELLPDVPHQGSDGHDFAIMVMRAVPAPGPFLLQLHVHLDAPQPALHRSVPSEPIAEEPNFVAAGDSQDDAKSCIELNLQPVWQLFNLLDEHFFLPSFLLDLLPMNHPAAATWVHLPWWNPEDETYAIELYFDGSYNCDAEGNVHAGTGCVAFAQTSRGWYQCGGLMIPVPFAGDSYQAELWAGIYALKFGHDLLKMARFYCPWCPPTLTLKYDSLTVGEQLLGHWAIRRCKKEGRILRGLCQWIEHRFNTRIAGTHVHSHRGEPGNELADTLAQCAADQHPEVQAAPAWNELFASSDNLDSVAWLWILHRPDFDKNREGNFTIPLQAATHPGEDVLLHCPLTAPPAPSDQMADLNLTLCTCNVLTLRGHAHDPQRDQLTGMHGPSRQQAILRQLHDNGVHIFALQETRLRRQVGGLDPNYILFASPATDDGHFGMMIGLCTSKPYGHLKHQNGHTTPLFFHSDQVAIIAQSPRMLILRLRTPLFHAILLAAHAPHTGQSADDIAYWWHQLKQAIPAKYATYPRILLADANARVGTSVCDCIGSHQAEPGDHKSESFEEFIRTEALWLPSTFDIVHHGPGGTWKHHTGQWRRNDFVALPTAWHYDRVSSWVADDVDVSLLREDHCAALVQFQRTVRLQPQPGSIRSPKLGATMMDWTAFDTSCLAPDWHRDVHSHASQIQQHLAEIAQPYVCKQPRAPLKTTMSEATWQLVQNKRDWRKHLFESIDLQNASILRTFFQCWRQRSSEDTASSAMATLLRRQDLLIAEALHQFRLLGRRVQQALRADDVAFFTHLLREGADLLHPSQVRSLWKVIRRSLPKFRQRKSAVPPMQREDLEDQWIPHFREIEVGIPATEASLIAGCTLRQQQAVATRPTRLQIADVPSMLEFEEVLRQTQMRKATGLDGFTSDFYHAHATPLAEVFYPLIMKTFLWQEEPVSWKGGIMAVIPKGNAQATQANKFRGIMLMPVVAKQLHAILRKRLALLLGPQRPPGQIGGFAGQQVQFGSQYLRCVGRLADSRRLCSATFFLDLKNAFHRLVRETVVGASRMPEDLDTVLRNLVQDGLPVDHLLAGQQLPCLLESLGASPILVRFLREIHCSTWFTLDTRTFTQTLRGTRPGSPLADIIFHVGMWEITKIIDSWLRNQPEILNLFQRIGVEPVAIVWSDDVALTILTAEAGLLIPKLEELIRFVWTTFRDRGFDLNFDVGKTNAILSLHGPGAAELRRTHLLQSRPGFSCSLDAENQQWIHCPAQYRHLGTMFCANHTLDVEIDRRIGQGRSAFQQIRKSLFTNRALPQRLRLQLFRALVLSKMFFGLGAWQTPTQAQIQKLRTAVSSMLRSILGKGQQPCSQADLFDLAHQPDVRVRLALDRLAYAEKFFQHAPVFIQQAAHQEHAQLDHSWLHGLFADLAWLVGVLPQQADQTWTSDLTTLLDRWQQGPSGWKALLKRAYRYHRQQEHLMLNVHYLHRQIFAVLEDSGIVFDPSPSDLDPAEKLHECRCGKAFTTFRGLATHQRRQHQMMSLEHAFLSGAECPVCHIYTWTTQRLQQHLSYIPRRGGVPQVNPCYQALLEAGIQLPYHCEKMPAQVQGLARRDALQMEGPCIDLQPQRDRLRLQRESDLAALLEEQRNIPRPADPTTASVNLRRLLTHHTRKWCASHGLGRSSDDRDKLAVEIGDIWLAFLCEFPEEYHDWLADEFRRWGQVDLPLYIETLIDGVAEFVLDDAFAAVMSQLPRYALHLRINALRAALNRDLAFPPMAPVPHRPLHILPQSGVSGRHKIHEPVPRLYEDQEHWQQQLRKCRMVQETPMRPAPILHVPGGAPCVYIVHLFSGRRRAGDVHDHLHRLLPADLSVRVLSMDTAVSMSLGDLSQSGVPWKHLVDLYRAGLVLATICGTPCETFSQARHTPKPPEAQGRWPRPLRSFLRLFGLDGLTMKELKQLDLGGAFFLQGLWALALQIASGGYFISEHPAPPDQIDRASIWTSALMSLLLQFSELKLHVLAQWRWGSTAVKPTGLLCLRLPYFTMDCYAQAIPNIEKPTQAAIGVNAAGAFRTSAHKEYPDAFCKALASAVVNQFNRDRIHGRTVQLPPKVFSCEFEDWLQACLEAGTAVWNSCWLPDYQR